MTRLPWSERVPMLAVNPDAATREDVTRLVESRMSTWHTVRDVLCQKLNCTRERADEIAAEICRRLDEEPPR